MSCYTLKNDKTAVKIQRMEGKTLINFFPSSDSPSNIVGGVFDAWRYACCRSARVNLWEYPLSDFDHPVVRVFKDIFLVLLSGPRRWALVRLYVPCI
eukprot:gnl/Chilomastix_caulleri/4838.p1 GENE.gnl/Chilomastix_caulleri/4838~~gnl/Chilomastix_caulleri/4838.p1  ORF type:complete len:97 (-),score=14.45 gnl/Chilomastix_caulleri/4838:39-329(-)